VYFTGRDLSWLRVDGENFLAKPIEDVIQRHPAVYLCCVYGVPDVDAGDRVMATIVLAENAAFDGAEFVAFLRAQPDVSPKWLPTYVRVARIFRARRRTSPYCDNCGAKFLPTWSPIRSTGTPRRRTLSPVPARRLAATASAFGERGRQQLLERLSRLNDLARQLRQALFDEASTHSSSLGNAEGLVRRTNAAISRPMTRCWSGSVRAARFVANSSSSRWKVRGTARDRARSAGPTAWRP
jgi:hypothetical protein